MRNKKSALLLVVPYFIWELWRRHYAWTCPQVKGKVTVTAGTTSMLLKSLVHSFRLSLQIQPHPTVLTK